MKNKQCAWIVVLMSCLVSGAWAANVTIEAGEFESFEGEVIFLLLAEADKEAWPEGEDVAKCLAKERVTGKKMLQICKNIAPGTYAVTVVHDKNGNGYLDHGVFGPKEDYGFTNGARAFFGPAKFEKCSFVVGEEDVVVQVLLK